ncbi:hypothetical protein GCM10010402_21270 [Actinomadura luteofluorescens]|uniref:hypothetical protein n=1 Tax=Actinomadura luteofluorescens TaxID=46163 RepID=UPI0021646AE0|nr:hypothetical protein [Actinomadura glauciflava]MCR3745267.1 hypothetical protein [Actinomadura glauciflava]
MEDVYRRFSGGWERREDLLARAQQKGATWDDLRAAEARRIDLAHYVDALEAGASDEEIHAAVAAGILPWLFVRAMKANATPAQIMEAYEKQVAADAAYAWGIGGSGYIDLLNKGATHDELIVLHDKDVHPQITQRALESRLGIAKLLEAYDQGLRGADLLCYVEAQENQVNPDEVLDAHRRGLRGLELYGHMRELAGR